MTRIKLYATVLLFLFIGNVKNENNNILDSSESSYDEKRELDYSFSEKNSNLKSRVNEDIQHHADDCKCNKGKCVPINGKLTCTCPPEFGVYRWKSIEECKACACGKGVNCTYKPSTWSYGKECVCPFGFNYISSGKKCEDACTKNPCRNSGTCEPIGKSFKCNCKTPFFGETCDKKLCDPNPCLNGGKCNVKGNSSNCDCKIPYTGNTCGEDPCTKNPCKNGGTCKVDGNSYKCYCKAPYLGNTCEKVDPCSSNPCKNKGNCSSDGKSIKCTCTKPYYGVLCEKDPCTYKPCKNNGTCTVGKIGYICSCKKPFSGKSCEKDPCMNKPCQNNGTCSIGKEDYACSCNAPFSGRNCEIGPCTKSPCKNGGACKVDGKGFKCNCTAPYSGITCEEDPCTKKPCKNGGTCKLDGKGFKCNCTAPNSGTTCEEDLCTKKPCKNGGTCKLDGKGFKCNCTAPYSGITCEEDVCSKKPCKNGGTCKLDGKSFKCDCKAPFLGNTCEEDLCTKKPCKNGGICKLDGKSFKCDCKAPFSGNTCEEDFCTKQPCKNGGICKLDGKSFKCDCKAPFSGNTCEDECKCENGECQKDNKGNLQCVCLPQYGKYSEHHCKECECGPGANCTFDADILGIMDGKKCICPFNFKESKGRCEDACTNTPCKNNGTCKPLGNSFNCSCKQPYFGDACEKSPCTKNPCLNNGTCSVYEKSYKCECKSPYSGKNCTEDPCTVKPCKNGGTCKVNGTSFKCDCKEPYSGKTCQTKCTCENGHCITDSEGIAQCTCPPEFGKYTKTLCTACKCGKGANCTFDPGFFTGDGKKCVCPLDFKESDGICEDACTNTPCKNGGTCLPMGKTFKCTCKEPYFGDTCEKDACTNAPCKNGGTCRPMGKTFKCTCKEPYFGDTCEKDTCTNTPCKNGGTCQPMGKTFKCTCKEPYLGDTCEKDACTNSPCKNGGTCKLTGKTFNCTCKMPFYGDTCEKVLKHPCTNNPCQNGGTCKEDGASFKCDCKTPYYGTTCETGPCTSNPCKNGGTCKVYKDTFKCDCKTPYSGNTCENDPCTKKPCQNGGTCKVNGTAFKCICQDPYLGNECEKDLCTENPCKNGGVCKLIKDNFNCKCSTPFSGKFCERDPCTDNPCKNNGNCTIENNDFKCSCSEPFYGSNCDQECICVKGVCKKVNSNNDLQCFCPPEHGLTFGGVCEECNCGKNANCTFKKWFFEFNKTCICPEGYEENNGICKEIQATTIQETSLPSTMTPSVRNITEEFNQTTVIPPNSTIDFKSTTHSPSNFTRNFNETTYVPSNFSTTTYVPTNVTSDFNETTDFPSNFTSGFSETTFHPTNFTADFNETTDESSNTTYSEIVTQTSYSSESTAGSTNSPSFSSTTQEPGPCKDYCKNGGTCKVVENSPQCICPYPFGGKTCEGSQWCEEGDGKAICPKDSCIFNFTSRIGRCVCPKDQYFNYEQKMCEAIDICATGTKICSGKYEMCKNGNCECQENFKRNDKKECVPTFCEANPYPCNENELCEDISSDPGSVKCICNEGYIFDGQTCIKSNKCTLPSTLDCHQVCNPETQRCECKKGFTLQPNNKTCVLADSTKKCKKSCGVGVCVKAEKDEVCVCPITHTISKNTCMDLCAAKSMPKGMCPNDECVSDQKLGFKCKCEGKLILSQDGVTCRRRLMCSEGNGSEICKKRNGRCVEDIQNEEGFRCDCKPEEEHDTDGVCTYKCVLKKYQEKCSKLLAKCEMEGSEPICRCPPMLTFNKDNGKCTQMAQASFVANLPVTPHQYNPLPSKNDDVLLAENKSIVINLGQMGTEVRAAMKRLFGQNYLFAEVWGFTMTSEKKTSCLVELQFREDPKDQINLISDQNICISIDADSCFIPPGLVMAKKDIKPNMFTATDPCMEYFKERNCGKETDCKKINNETNNFQCTCAEGFKSYGYYQPFDDERTIIHKCEDINECLLPRACPNRTRCINTYGSHACPCLSGFKPVNESSDTKLSGCVEICNPKLCGHGKCEIKGDKYGCQCDAGYGGDSCDVEEHLTAGPAGMKVALIVLSTLVVPLMLLSVYMVYQYQLLKKKSYSNNYLDDASSTINLQPMRGGGSRHPSQYN